MIRLTLSQQFLLLGSFLVLVGLSIPGFWVSSRIERIEKDDVIRSAASYVQSLVSPHLPDIPLDRPLPETVIAALDRSVEIDPGGIGVEEIKVCTPDGALLYDSVPSRTGATYELTEQLRAAAGGSVVVVFEDWPHDVPASPTSDDPDVESSMTLLEAYVPIRQTDSGEIVATGEFHQDAMRVRTEIRSALTQSWTMAGAISIGLIAGLYTVVESGSRLIQAQRADLDRRVDELTSLLSRNDDLRRKERSATQRSATDTESQLRRIGSDLHDGVGQLITIVTLKLGDLFRDDAPKPADYTSVRDVLQEAMTGIREVAAGLALPEIEPRSRARSSR